MGEKNGGRKVRTTKKALVLQLNEHGIDGTTEAWDLGLI